MGEAIRVESHADGPAVRHALRRTIRALQADDPVRPVTVAVPSNYAGLSLRRGLARSHGDDPGGLLNVRFLVLARVIEMLGAPVLAARGQKPLTPALHAELIRDALQREPGVFAPVAGHPSTVLRLEQTFEELGELTNAERAALGASGEQPGDVVRLFEAVRQRLEGRYYDDTALAVAAAEAARSKHPALRDLGAIVLHGPRMLTHTELAFIEAAAMVTDVVVLLAVTGDALAEGPIITQWEKYLGGGNEGLQGTGSAGSSESPHPDPGASPRQALPSRGEGTRPQPPTATRVVSAPDAEEEVRQAVRIAIELAGNGTPLHRIALLSRHASPYAALAVSQLEAAGIPWNGGNPATLAQSIAGRTLLGLLDLPTSDFARADVSAWLNASPVLDPLRQRTAPAHRWDAIARAAGIVRTPGQWRERLVRHQRRIEKELKELEFTDDPAEWKRTGLERDIRDTAALRAFIEDLIPAVAIGQESDWPTLSGWALGLLERWLGSETALHNRLSRGSSSQVAADAEIESYRAVRGAVESLAALADVRPRVDLPTFRRAAQRELDRPAWRIGRFGEGLFVGRLSDAAATEFDHVFVLGMNEGSIPTKGSDDPLVPDSGWDGARTHMTRRERRRAEERRYYLAALASASERTLLAPRADLRGQQERLRSRWLLESASALAGRTVSNEDLEAGEIAAAAWHVAIPSFDYALGRDGIAASIHERDLRSLRAWKAAGERIEQHPTAVGMPQLLQGWGAQSARRSFDFTQWDGLVQPVSERHLAEAGGREHSPTSLERFARCPRQYLFSTILRIPEREEPEETLSISAADRGTLMHEILQRFIDERRPSTPDTKWTASDRERLMEIAWEECARVEADGLTGSPFLWRHDRERILRDIAMFPDIDQQHRAEAGVVPVQTELEFGGDKPASVDLGGGRTVRLRGRIDRVDRSPDGERTIVIDYKSGGAYGYRKLDDDPVQNGRLLQLPIYAIGAKARLGAGVGRIDARYWFTRGDVKPEDRFVGYEVDEWVMGRFREALGLIADGIAGGTFVGVPGAMGNGEYENCRFCPYVDACGSNRAREFERKKMDGKLGRFRILAAIEDETAAGEDGAE